MFFIILTNTTYNMYIILLLKVFVKEERMKYKIKDFEFSKKDLREQVYKRATKDYENLLETFENNDFDFKKLKKDILYMNACGKEEFDFDWQSLKIICENDNGKIKIKETEIYNIKTLEFLCYMTFKN